MAKFCLWGWRSLPVSYYIFVTFGLIIHSEFFVLCIALQFQIRSMCNVYILYIAQYVCSTDCAIM